MSSDQSHQVGLKGRPPCAGVSVLRTMRLWRGEVEGRDERFSRRDPHRPNDEIKTPAAVAWSAETRPTSTAITNATTVTVLASPNNVLRKALIAVLPGPRLTAARR